MKTALYVLLVLWVMFYFLYPKPQNSHAEERPTSPVQQSLAINDTVVISAPKVSGNDEISINPADYKGLILKYFKDVPKMMKIINCESGFKQFKDNGDTLISDTSDAGLMQINHTNWEWAKKLGFDIFNSPEDNVKMGRVIYESQGLDAWTCSKII